MEHWAVMMDKELFFYKNMTDSKFKIMHSLAGAQVTKVDPWVDPDSEKLFFPIMLTFPNKLARLLYFDSTESQKTWVFKLR